MQGYPARPMLITSPAGQVPANFSTVIDSADIFSFNPVSCAIESGYGGSGSRLELTGKYKYYK
jgi:hypothetical protein